MVAGEVPEYTSFPCSSRTRIAAPVGSVLMVTGHSDLLTMLAQLVSAMTTKRARRHLCIGVLPLVESTNRSTAGLPARTRGAGRGREARLLVQLPSKILERQEPRSRLSLVHPAVDVGRRRVLLDGAVPARRGVDVAV